MTGNGWGRRAWPIGPWSIGIVALVTAACGGDEGDLRGGAGGTSSGTASGTATGTATGTGSGSGGAGACEVPTTTAELEAFLATGDYTGWNAESGPHDSAGPHFGDVRVYVNGPLFDSLEAGNATHPPCSAAVKELYGDGATVLGHSVSVKVADGTDGDAWYWYELYDGTSYADGVGVSLCTNCHGGGQDFVLSPYPLQ